MDPRLLAIVGILFLALGGFSFVVARRRLRATQMQGQPAVWYKDLGLITSIEYVLLGILVCLNLTSNVVLGGPLRAARDILYAFVLFLTIVALLTVVFLMLKRPRRRQAAPQTVTNIQVDADTQSSEERAAILQRKRERRQNAAATRRRHAGRA